MANFNIPNLCGASPELNGALDEINKLKDKLLSSIDLDASELKHALETSLGDGVIGVTEGEKKVRKKLRG